MIFTPTPLEGLFTIDPERIVDERGFFARTWSRGEFEARGLDPAVAQCNVAFNLKKGTLRGMHYQVPPHTEAKLVRCTRGAIYDVTLDIRPGSATFGHWLAFELTADNLRMVYIPEGLAHGYQTLEDGSEVFYQMSELYHPGSARGVRWDDPAFEIRWPLPPGTMSERDRSFPLHDGRGRGGRRGNR